LKYQCTIPLDYGGPTFYTGCLPNEESGMVGDMLEKYGNNSFVSGICIILSKKACSILIQYSELTLSYGIIDDVAIGVTLNKFKDDLIFRSFPRTSWNSNCYESDVVCYRNRSSDRNMDIENMENILKTMKLK